MTTSGQQEGTLANPCSACHGCGWDNPAQAIDRCRHCGGNGMEPNAEDQPAMAAELYEDLLRPAATTNADGPSAEEVRAVVETLHGMAVNRYTFATRPASFEMRAADLIDRLAARLAETQAKHTANHDAWLDEVVRLKRELSEAQKDAERYRWLRDSRGTTPFVVDGKGWQELWSKLVGAELDVAIDAAMKEGK